MPVFSRFRSGSPVSPPRHAGRDGNTTTSSAAAPSFQPHSRMADASLSSVVSGLVRAQMGTSVSSTVTDEDLDRHVAELILKEAKKKAEQYGKQGISAYLPQPDSNVPKTNKRFLSSIIRNTDDHNKTILRAQALSAADIRTERDAQLRADRQARAREAAAAERARRSGCGRGDSWDRDRDHRRRDRSRERYGSDEGEDRWQPSKRRRDDGDEEEDHPGSRSARRRRHGGEGSSRRHRHRSRAPSDDEEREKRRRRRRRTSRSRSRDPNRDNERSARGGGDSTSKRHRSHSPDDEGHRSRQRRQRRSSRSPSAGGSADTRSRSKRHSDRRDDSHRRRRRSHSRTPDKASRSETLSEGLDSGNQRPGGSRASSQPPPAEDRAGDLARRESELRRKLKGKGKASPAPEITSQYARSHSPTLVLDTPHHAAPRPPSPGPRPPRGPPPPLPPPDDFSADSVRPDLPSKMDKYFDASYDPRLDVAPLAAPSIPATGLIDNAEFEGWDAMLELIKQRRADKAERKRLERLGLVEKSGKDKDKDKDRKKSKSKVAGLGVAGTLAGWSEGGDGLMDIEYKKRGSVREWDLGKETPT
ncbi:hypothetical protein BC826DRAFT_993935 [Russula brevipes]|nr:hypothetical protein BC826DRAFT_993935 [Russula brevipes]